MNKAALIADVQQHLGVECSKAHAERVVQAVLGAIERGLQADGEVQLVGFGTFQVKQRAARLGRNPQTNAPMQLAASTSVGFRVGARLRKAVAESADGPRGDA